MSTPSSAAPASLAEKPRFCLMEHVKPFLAPYYLTVAAVLGALTVGFVTLIVVLIMIAANYNLLGAIE